MKEFYRVIINTPNLFIIHKGKQIRTPINLKVHISELDLFKMKIRQFGIDDYSIEEYNELKYDIASVQIENEVLVDEYPIEKEGSSNILEQLIKEK